LSWLFGYLFFLLPFSEQKTDDDLLLAESSDEEFMFGDQPDEFYSEDIDRENAKWIQTQKC